jgi:LPXTG-motif cell wall-anchored protein
METLKNAIATFVAGILSLPYVLFAQDQGTYIDNLGVQDSSYMEQDLLAQGVQGTGGAGATVVIIIIVVVVIIIGAVVYFLKKKK